MYKSAYHLLKTLQRTIRSFGVLEDYDLMEQEMSRPLKEPISAG